MAAYHVHKSGAYPEKIMNGEAIALMAVRCFQKQPALWGHIEDNSGRMDPCCTNAAWDRMMEFPHHKGDDGISWRSRPDILIETFKGSKVAIHAITLSAALPQELLTGPDTMVFLAEDSRTLQVLNPAKGTLINENHIIVNPGPDFYEFESDDPAWPWPVLYPQRFNGLIEMGKQLLNKDVNPLTGLCRANDGAYRTLAKQTAANFKKAYDQIARDIVASL